MNNSNQISISVIIPVFDKWELTKQCLASLAQHSNDDIEVIVVDNGSTDDTCYNLDNLGARLFPGRFKKIRFDQNINFGPACNRAAEVAAGEFLFLLNNDTIIHDECAYLLRNEFFLINNLAAVGPLLKYKNDTVQHYGIAIFPDDGIDHIYKRLPISHRIFQSKKFFKIITAAACMIPKQIYYAFNGFNENFENGFEDVDLCLRLSQNGNYLLCCIPNAIITHLEEQSSGRKDKDKKNYEYLKSLWNLGKIHDCIDIAFRDGYDIKVSHAFGVKFVTSIDTNHYFLEKLRNSNMDISVAIQLLQKENLWDNGYDLVGKFFEETNDNISALNVYRAATKVQGFNIDDYIRLRRVYDMLSIDTSILEDTFTRLKELIISRNLSQEYFEKIIANLWSGSNISRRYITHFRNAKHEAEQMMKKWSMENNI